VRLFILRHGDAPFDPVARERVLSSLGRAETDQVVRSRTAELSDIPLILCSPVRRARETLAVLQDTINPTSAVVFDDCLRSESRVDRVEKYMDALSSNQPSVNSLLFISHQPLVGHMLNYLVDDSLLGMRMGTSCLACLDLVAFSHGCGTLQWLDYPQ